jgi:hypothetical protein
MRLEICITLLSGDPPHPILEEAMIKRSKSNMMFNVPCIFRLMYIVSMEEFSVLISIFREGPLVVLKLSCLKDCRKESSLV